jgi:hypothetical protein
VSVLALPPPMLTPPSERAPGKTSITFWPSRFTCSSTSARAPWPRPTIVITAATPMMTPSAVSIVRIMLRRSARTEMTGIAVHFTA